ncbi:MAG: hypothetical protein VW576_05280 [Opitutae bacterium]
MKESKETKEGKTILILDDEHSITEITCKSIFPNLSVTYTGRVENLEVYLKNNDFEMVILATKDKNLSTEILTLYEKGKFDILPLEIIECDTSSVKSETLAELTLFNLINFRHDSLRTKVNFLASNRLSKILNTSPLDSLQTDEIKKQPLLFDLLIQAIDKKDQDSCLSFCKIINNLNIEKSKESIHHLLSIIVTFKIGLDFISLFFEAKKFFFDEDHFKQINLPLVILIDGIARILRKEIFQVSGLNFNLQLFFTAFDRNAEFKTLHFIQEIAHPSNNFVNTINIFTLSHIFQNENYLDKTLPSPSVKLSKVESAFASSSAKLIEISGSINQTSVKEKFDLSIGYVEYATYLLKGSKSKDLTPVIRRYIETNE